MFSQHCSILIWILFGVTHVAADTAANHPKLPSCPNSPNCVSSQSPDPARYIEPLRYTGNLADARQMLINILKSAKRVRLVKTEPDFIHAEFHSFIFRFVDDVEFYFPADQAIIHVKSASRTGYYDFGVNRRRVNQLRLKFESLAE